MNRSLNRRKFLGTTSTAGAAAAAGLTLRTRGADPAAAKPAALGGPKAHPDGFPGWPMVTDGDEKAVLGTLRSGQWFRGGGTAVAAFEKAYARLTVMNKSEYVSNLAKNHHFLKIYGEKRLQVWLERNRDCPQNERLCREAVWFAQTMLLGTPTDMDQIADAIRKIQKHGPELARA